MRSSDFFRNWNPDFFGFLEKSKSRLFDASLNFNPLLKTL